MKSPTAAVAANGFRKTGLFPCYRHIFLEESERNITSYLLEISVPCSRIAEEPPITSGTNPQTLSNSHSACPRKNNTVIVLFSDISPVPDTFCRKQDQPTKHEQSRKGFAAIWTSSPTKTNFKKTERGKRLDIRGNLPSKYGCRRGDSPVQVPQVFHSFVVNVS